HQLDQPVGGQLPAGVEGADVRVDVDVAVLRLRVLSADGRERGEGSARGEELAAGGHEGVTSCFRRCTTSSEGRKGCPPGPSTPIVAPESWKRTPSRGLIQSSKRRMRIQSSPWRQNPDSRLVRGLYS